MQSSACSSGTSPPARRLARKAIIDMFFREGFRLEGADLLGPGCKQHGLALQFRGAEGRQE
eukprot:12663465-Heterocapsa_arctica.AAC.1